MKSNFDLSWTKLKLNLNLSKQNVTALGVTLFACHYIYTNYANDKASSSVDRVESQISAATTRIAELRDSPSVPMITDSWGKLLRAADNTGVYLVPVQTTDFADGALYQGPLRSWSATLTGTPKAVLSVLHEAQKSVPLYLFHYEIEEQVMNVNVSVVGK